jgi:hypothetical protein
MVGLMVVLRAALLVVMMVSL